MIKVGSRVTVVTWMSSFIGYKGEVLARTGAGGLVRYLVALDVGPTTNFWIGEVECEV